MKKIILNSILCFLVVTVSQAQEIPKWKLADLEAAIKNAEKPTIFNFWATFCKPCVEEIPYFQELVKKYDSTGIQLVLVSLDFKENYPKKIRTFASKAGFIYPITYLDETNADLFCPLVDESWSGSLPATLLIDNKKGYRKFFEEQIKKETLEKEIMDLLK